MELWKWKGPAEVFNDFADLGTGIGETRRGEELISPRMTLGVLLFISSSVYSIQYRAASVNDTEREREKKKKVQK